MGFYAMTDIDSTIFKTSQVATAAGVPIGTLRAYFSRGHWRVIGKKAEGEGLPNLFSARDVMAFAVAARLIDAAGVHPKAAFEIAWLEFVGIASGGRNPGELFNVNEHGETLLIYWPATGNAQIVAADDVKSISDILGRNSAEQEAATVINLNPLYHRVMAALGVDGRH